MEGDAKALAWAIPLACIVGFLVAVILWKAVVEPERERLGGELRLIKQPTTQEPISP